MQINEIRVRQQVAAINSLLERRFGLTIDVMDADHLASVRDHYREKRASMLAHLGESAAMQHPTYAKSFLIAEAATIILREISPKRMKRKSKPTA